MTQKLMKLNHVIKNATELTKFLETIHVWRAKQSMLIRDSFDFLSLCFYIRDIIKLVAMLANQTALQRVAVSM